MRRFQDEGGAAVGARCWDGIRRARVSDHMAFRFVLPLTWATGLSAAPSRARSTLDRSPRQPRSHAQRTLIRPTSLREGSLRCEVVPLRVTSQRSGPSETDPGTLPGLCPPHRGDPCLFRRALVRYRSFPPPPALRFLAPSAAVLGVIVFARLFFLFFSFYSLLRFFFSSSPHVQLAQYRRQMPCRSTSCGALGHRHIRGRNSVAPFGGNARLPNEGDEQQPCAAADSMPALLFPPPTPP